MSNNILGHIIGNNKKTPGSDALLDSNFMDIFSNILKGDEHIIANKYKLLLKLEDQLPKLHIQQNNNPEEETQTPYFVRKTIKDSISQALEDIRENHLNIFSLSACKTKQERKEVKQLILNMKANIDDYSLAQLLYSLKDIDFPELGPNINTRLLQILEFRNIPNDLAVAIQTFLQDKTQEDEYESFMNCLNNSKSFASYTQQQQYTKSNTYTEKEILLVEEKINSISYHIPYQDIHYYTRYLDSNITSLLSPQSIQHFLQHIDIENLPIEQCLEIIKTFQSTQNNKAQRKILSSIKRKINSSLNYNFLDTETYDTHKDLLEELEIEIPESYLEFYETEKNKTGCSIFDWPKIQTPEDERNIRNKIFNIDHTISEEDMVRLLISLKDVSFEELGNSLSMFLLYILERKGLTYMELEALKTFIENKEGGTIKRKLLEKTKKNMYIANYQNTFPHELKPKSIKTINSILYNLDEKIRGQIALKHIKGIQLFNAESIYKGNLDNLLSSINYSWIKFAEKLKILESLYLLQKEHDIDTHIQTLLDNIRDVPETSHPGYGYLILYRVLSMYNQDISEELKKNYQNSIDNLPTEKSPSEDEAYEKISSITEIRIEKNVFSYGYEMDIFIPALQLNIEIDGHHHERQKGYDHIRDSFLQDKGIQVQRIQTNELTKELPKLVKKLKKQIEELYRDEVA